jgi:hypothetical protein
MSVVLRGVSDELALAELAKSSATITSVVPGQLPDVVASAA